MCHTERFISFLKSFLKNWDAIANGFEVHTSLGDVSRNWIVLVYSRKPVGRKLPVLSEEQTGENLSCGSLSQSTCVFIKSLESICLLVRGLFLVRLTVDIVKINTVLTDYHNNASQDFFTATESWACDVWQFEVPIIFSGAPNKPFISTPKELQ